MSSAAMLTTRQLVRTFGSLRAVDGVDLAVGEHTIRSARASASKSLRPAITTSAAGT
jgi:hypothetical protein